MTTDHVPGAGEPELTAGDTAVQQVRQARSFLFVPGDRTERFDKAVVSEADVVIIDLEDAVAPEAKATARGSRRPVVDRRRTRRGAGQRCRQPRARG